MKFFKFSLQDGAVIVNDQPTTISSSVNAAATKFPIVGKRQLIHTIADCLGITRAEVDVVLNAALAAIANELRNGNEVSFPGFGRLTTKKSKRTVYRNPRSGKKVTVNPKRIVKFKAAKALKNAVNT